MDQVGGTFEITLEAYTDTVEVNPSGAYTILEGDPIEVGGVFKVLPGTVVQFSTANQITIDADGEYFGILGDVSLNLESASDLIIQPTVSTTEFAHTLGNKVYENTNHLGNVLTTISDRKLAYDDASNGTGVDYFIADVVSYSDYYPFGWVLPGRNGNATAYRYGYQGSEMDNEVKGSVSTQYTTYFRGLDTRVVRWWSVDPITHPHQTPYSVMNGNPIIYNDPFGDKVKYKDRASRREARRRRKTDEAFAEKLQGLKDDKRITYYLDHQKGSGRDLNVAIDEELEALKGKPLQRSPVVEWESQGEARSDLNRGNNGEDLTPMTPTRPRLSISRAGNTLPAINIAPIQMPPTNNPFIPVNNTPIWFMRNIPFNRSSDNISNSAQAELTLQPLADALINNPGVTLTIFGNTFADPTQNNASSPAWVNGQIMNY